MNGNGCAWRWMGRVLLLSSLACGGTTSSGNHRQSDPNAPSSGDGASEGAEGLSAPEESPEGERPDASSRETTAAIKRCYEAELAQNPTLHGTVRVDMIIETNGDITNVVVTENTVSPTVGECVAEVLRRARFVPGPADGPVRRSFPIEFEHGN